MSSAAATAGTLSAAAPQTSSTPTSQAAGQALASPGTVYGRPVIQEPADDLPPVGRRLPRLRVGTHVATGDMLRRIRVGAPATGLMLGRDRDNQPVTARFLRPEPTRITLVGGLWAARILVFRALALGVRVVVFTTQPDQWQGFGRWATGRDDKLAVLSGERPVAVNSTPHRPTMLLYDVGPFGATQRPQLGPWQTQFTVLRQLTAFGFPALQESGLVILQRLAPDEAYAASSVLQLTPQTSKLLQVLRDDMVTLLGGGADRYVWVRPTDIERRQFGQPGR